MHTMVHWTADKTALVARQHFFCGYPDDSYRWDAWLNARGYRWAARPDAAGVLVWGYCTWGTH